jgi:tRNA threonylcarbamoyladenosine biosynthesis protein TsaE
VSESRVINALSVEDTESLGARLGSVLRPGDFVGLSGDLGAGKTVFARGVARGAGVPAEALVASPTFALVNDYRGGRVPLYHADLYRVKDAEELYDAGFYDLTAGDGALVVEWIDRVPSAAPEDWLEIRIRKSPAGRELTILPHGERAMALAWRI